MSAPATTSATPGEAGFSHRQILVIMSGLMLGMFLAALDQTIVSTALPTIVGDFHGADLLSWVITAYLLASSACSSSPSSCSWWPARCAASLRTSTS
jgi:MFS family permease